MVKPVLSILTLCVLVACSQQQSSTPAASTVLESVVAVEPRPADIYEQLGWLYRQTQAKLTNITPEQADKIYLDYREERKQIVKQINEKEEKLLVALLSDEGAASGVKSQIQDLAKWQLEAVDADMEMKIRVMPAHEVALFANKVSPATQQFIEIQAEHDKKMVFGDAAILVSWQELGKYVADWEQWLQKHPQHPLVKEVKLQFEMYAAAYLFGSDNTPVVNVGNADVQLVDLYEEYQKIDQEWQQFAQKYPSSQLTPLFAQVRELVKKNDEQGYELIEQFKKQHFPVLMAEQERLSQTIQ